MRNQKILNKARKIVVILVVSMSTTLSVTTDCFASQRYYVSGDGIGIEVYNPMKNIFKVKGSRSIIEGDKVSVSGGQLWATWDSGLYFRANYDHSSQTHRCTARNGNNKSSRSGWAQANCTAQSDWVVQTWVNNRVFAATEE